ncbi:hypothetical protein CAPTEDRAFT_210666 [Capitella teleta]|uniref:Pacifastin domain-containing protein n=1 Tax=Capitella teleta TaxID=283909 RepID=R7V0F3_CAPTE|nr:hypothetical protein CAPTEDRAFT_210666 [Capitella teleta]|eukprot:ELU12024.1 hypothetical protein CAPTEDRAFT_210666 [Capitella teleta]
MKIIVLVCVAIALYSVADAKKNNGKGSSKVETTDPPCFTQEDCAQVIDCEYGYERATHNYGCYACECRDEPCALFPFKSVVIFDSTLYNLIKPLNYFHLNL